MHSAAELICTDLTEQGESAAKCVCADKEPEGIQSERETSREREQSARIQLLTAPQGEKSQREIEPAKNSTSEI